MKQRDRQLKRYQRHRPIDTEEYQLGYSRALVDLRNGGGCTSSPYHLDSGRYLRWSMGYQDALYYLATEMYNMHQHKLNVKVFWLNTEEHLTKKLLSKDAQ